MQVLVELAKQARNSVWRDIGRLARNMLYDTPETKTRLDVQVHDVHEVHKLAGEDFELHWLHRRKSVFDRAIQHCDVEPGYPAIFLQRDDVRAKEI